MEQFWNVFWSAIGILLTGLVSWVTTVVISWLNTKIKDKKAAQFASDVWLIITSAVNTVQQTYVDNMKKQGKFTSENQKEAFDKAVNIVKTQLTIELKTYIQEHFGDVEEYIKTQIESVIYQIKIK